MAEIIRMPRLSDTMVEGNIVSWLKQVGDKVSVGDILAEVETDKATMELESFYNGYLLYIGIPSGTVAVDGVIAIIGDKSEDVDAILKSVDGSKTVAASEPAPKSNNVTPSPAAIKEEPKPAVVVEAAPGEGRVIASPLAKSLAQEAGLNIANIEGSGDNGRIIKKDVEQALAKGSQPSSAMSSVSTPVVSGVDQEIPVTQMRKVIAKRLAESKFGAPHFYLTVEITMDAAIEARKAMNESGEVKISFNDMVVKASALALRKHPMINASWYGDKIVLHSNINIGVAVAVPDGLLVPVIPNTDYKSLNEINGLVKVLAGKAKEKKLQPQEMTGNTFTISNLGMLDIEEFTAIINPPDACILAVGSIVEKPIVKNGQIVVGNTMKVTLSCDHRIVDGATGAHFLQTLRGYLEKPVTMLV